MSGRSVGIGGGIGVHMGPSPVVPKKKAKKPEVSADDRALMNEVAGEAVSEMARKGAFVKAGAK